MILNLDALRDEANTWLLDQPPNRALCPCAIAYCRRRVCLPHYIVELMRVQRQQPEQKE